MIKNLRIYLFIFLLGINSLWAQRAREKTLSQACDCFPAQPALRLSSTELHQMSNLCIQKALEANLVELISEEKLDMQNDVLLAKFARNVGEQLYERCPKFRAYWAQLTENNIAEEKAQLPETKGKLRGLKQNVAGDKLFFELETEQGMESFLWGGRFQGSERFMNGLDTFEGKNAKVVWEVAYTFNPELKKYEEWRMLRFLDILPTIPAPPIILSKKEQAAADKAKKLAQEAEQKARIDYLKSQLKKTKGG
jgi:hypothetical protein